MMPVWLKQVGRLVAQRRQEKYAGETQDAFAERIQISPAQLSAIETGARSYTIEPLIQILAGLEDDPVQGLLDITRQLSQRAAEDLATCRILIEALNDDERRSLAMAVVQALQPPPRPPGKRNNGSHKESQ